MQGNCKFQKNTSRYPDIGEAYCRFPFDCFREGYFVSG